MKEYRKIFTLTSRNKKERPNNFSSLIDPQLQATFFGKMELRQVHKFGVRVI
jgi:hypothetical protein